MARTKAKLPGGARLADYLALGYLAMNCPINTVPLSNSLSFIFVVSKIPILLQKFRSQRSK